MELFWANGFEATSLTQLTEHLGIGRQSLYNEFGDKRGLFVAALRAYSDNMIGMKSEILGAPGSPLGNVRALCHHWLQMVEEGGCNGCMISNTTAEFGADDTEIHGIVTSCMRHTEDLFCGAFQRAKDLGELAPEAEPRDLARLFMSAGQGVSILSRLSGSNEIVGSTIRALLNLLPAGK